MKAKNKYILTGAFVFLSFGALVAQQDPMVSQYMFSGHFINPGYAGSHEYANLTFLVRRQWIGFEGAPLNSFLSFDSPVRSKRIGFGFLFGNDRIGVTNRTEVAGTFAYHLRAGKKGKLSLGLRSGFTHYKARLTDLIVWEENDQVFSQDISGRTLPNAGVGLYYYSTRFYAGASIPAVISYNPNTFFHVNATDAPLLERHYYAASGVVIPAGIHIDIKPSILFKYVPNSPAQADFNLNVLFHKTFWIGFSVRTGDGILAMAELQATKNFRLGYAYDMALTNMRKYNGGSHELMIAWDFVREELRYKSPRFF